MKSKIKHVFIMTARGYNTNGLVLAKQSGKLKGLVYGKYTVVEGYSLKKDRVSKICYVAIS
jgi:hypothetical protein